MKSVVKNVGFLGLGCYLPPNRLTNSDLERMVETTDEWITTRTGIKERRVVNKGEKTSHLAILAAKDALKNAKLDASKLDLIIVATITPDSSFPSTACLVQKALGARHATAFDVSAACAGFLYAVTMAEQCLKTGLFKNALVIAAETISSLIDWNDRGTCVLFGDGAGACVLGPVYGDKGIISDHLESQGEQSDLMRVVMPEGRHPSMRDGKVQDRKSHLPYVRMEGQELFKVAVNTMAQAAQAAIRKAGIDISEIDCVVPHQANDRIISAVAKKLGIPKDKFFINIDRYGNMSAASIAVALYEAVEHKRIRRGDHVLLVAFGAGLVSAANVVRW